MTLVCFALKEEAAPFRKIATRYPAVVTLVVGIGRVNAEQAIRSFLAGGASVPASREQSMPAPDRLARTLAPPSLVLTCGFAGGLNPDLKLGDVIFEPAGPAANDSKLIAALTSAGAKPAKLFCADRIATTAMEKWQLHLDTGADAVEMESAAIYAVCAENNIPCVTVRVISDTAHEDLPLDFNALAKPDKNLDFGKLALVIVRSPGKIPRLLALGKKTRFAAERLAAALEKIISP